MPLRAMEFLRTLRRNFFAKCASGPSNIESLLRHGFCMEALACKSAHGFSPPSPEPEHTHEEDSNQTAVEKHRNVGVEKV